MFQFDKKHTELKMYDDDNSSTRLTITTKDHFFKHSLNYDIYKRQHKLHIFFYFRIGILNIKINYCITLIIIFLNPSRNSKYDTNTSKSYKRMAIILTGQY